MKIHVHIHNNLIEFDSGHGTIELKFDDHAQLQHFIDHTIRVLLGLSGHRPSNVKFAVPQYANKEGMVLPGALTLPNDEMVTVPLAFTDAVAHSVHAPPDGGMVSVSDPTVVSASVSDDDTSVVITALADGTADVTYSNGTMTDTISVTVAEPTPIAVMMDADHAVFGAKS